MTDARPSSSELREKIVRDQVLPMAQHLFEREPRAASVMFLVAQFWSDEADDAVHGELLACVDPDPRWPECARYAANPIGSLDPDDEFDPEDGYVPTDDAFTAQYLLLEDVPTNIRYFDDNGEMIVAFAPFCLEGCDQDQFKNECYTPYCVLRRGVAEAEIVGQMLRPEWENRWDVIDAAEARAIESAARHEADRKAAAANPSPHARPTFATTLIVCLVAALALSQIFWLVLGR